MWIKLGTTQYRQYEFLGWSDAMGRNFLFYFTGDRVGSRVTIFGLI